MSVLDSTIGPTAAHQPDSVVRVLALGASSNEAEALFNVLRKGGLGVRPRHIEDARELPDQLSDQIWDLFIQVQPGDLPVSLEPVRAIREAGQDCPCLVLLDEVNETLACDLLEAGAQRVLGRSQPALLLAAVRAELSTLAERRAAHSFERLYRESERRCTDLLASSNEAIAYTAGGMHVFANGVYLEVFGYGHQDDIQGLPLLDLVAPGHEDEFREFMRGLEGTTGERTVEAMCIRAAGANFRALLTFSEASFDGEACFQVVVRDLSEQEALQAQLDRLRSRDRLTGLFNHLHFLHLLNQRLNHDDDRPTYVGLVELENFRRVRKEMGLTAGDEVVRELALTMVRALPQTDVSARIGDHTFAVMSGGTDRGEIEQRFNQVRSQIESHICDAGQQSVATTCSVGVALADPALGPEQALAGADDACREAIRLGGNQVRFFEPVVTAPTSAMPRTVALSESIDELVERRRLGLVFQPIVSLHGRSERCYEVFLRVEDAAGQIISTGEVFEAAAAEDKATLLDRWVIDQAVATAARCREQGETVRLFVKLSEHAMRDESVLLHLTKTLASSVVEPRQLVFQLNESTASGQVKMARAVVNLLKGLKCPTALEHFGTGINSLGTLNHLDVDYLKFDGSFLEGLAHDAQSQQALRDIQKTASRLNKETIATAVQDANSLAILWQCGVHLAQGHYIQEPTPELTYEFHHGG